MALLIGGISFANNATAQADTQHIKFKDVSMGENFGTFIEKLKQKGFRRMATEDEGMLSGQFYYDPVYISISTSPVSEVISSVLVFFLTEHPFETVSLDYSNYLGSMSEKYGKPTNLSDTSTYVPLNKTYREYLSTLQRNWKKYTASWVLPEGEIELNISENYILTLTYYDRINLDISNKEFKQVVDEEF